MVPCAGGVSPSLMGAGLAMSPVWPLPRSVSHCHFPLWLSGKPQAGRLPGCQNPPLAEELPLNALHLLEAVLEQGMEGAAIGTSSYATPGRAPSTAAWLAHRGANCCRLCMLHHPCSAFDL